MAGWTNRGKYNTLNVIGRAASAPANFNLALSTATTAPTADSNTLSDVSEIAAGNGYTSGGQSVARNSTDFDVLTEDDANDRALTQLKDFSWTASGGSLPGSGLGARYALLLDANATPANREIWFYWDLGSAYTVSVGQTITLQNCEIRINES